MPEIFPVTPLRPRELAAVAAVLAVFAALAVWFAASTGATYDETAHLPAAYSYLRWNDYHLDTDHPPLVKKIAALPLMFMRVWPDDPDALADSGVLDSGAAFRRIWDEGIEKRGDIWVFGHFFLYGIRPETFSRIARQNPAVENPLLIPPTSRLEPGDFCNDIKKILFASRLPLICFGLVLAVLIFCWARELFGFAGGLLAMTLFCADPNFIANTALVTTDAGAAMSLFGAVYFLCRTLRRQTVGNVLGFLIFFGAAFVIKFSAMILLPVFWLVAGAWLVFKRAAPLVRKIFFCAGLFSAAALAVFVSVWAAYSFRYSASLNRVANERLIEREVRRAAAANALLREVPADTVITEKQVEDRAPTAPISIKGQAFLFAARHHLLPESFLFGFVGILGGVEVRDGYLFGQKSSTGFRTYFLWTTLLKTPLPHLVLMIAGLLLVFQHARNPKLFFPLACLLIPAGLYFYMAIKSHLNIGHRHLLPALPFLYVLAGGVAVRWRGWRPQAKVVSGIFAFALIAVGGQVCFAPKAGASIQIIAPHYLSYFNEIIGGPARGWTALVDSNVDWGQDLPALRGWLAARHITAPIGLCYFGMDDARAWQIPHHNLPGGYKFEPEESFDVLKPGDYLAVSATKLAGVYLTGAQRQALAATLARSDFVDDIAGSIFIFRLRDNGSNASVRQ